MSKSRSGDRRDVVGAGDRRLLIDIRDRVRPNRAECLDEVLPAVLVSQVVRECERDLTRGLWTRLFRRVPRARRNFRPAWSTRIECLQHLDAGRHLRVRCEHSFKRRSLEERAAKSVQTTDSSSACVLITKDQSSSSSSSSFMNDFGSPTSTVIHSMMSSLLGGWSLSDIYCSVSVVWRCLPPFASDAVRPSSCLRSRSMAGAAARSIAVAGAYCTRDTESNGSVRALAAPGGQSWRRKVRGRREGCDPGCRPTRRHRLTLAADTPRRSAATP